MSYTFQQLLIRPTPINDAKVRTVGTHCIGTEISESMTIQPTVFITPSSGSDMTSHSNETPRTTSFPLVAYHE
jgi:hypothetical protein